MTYTIPEVRQISSGATDAIAIDCMDFLDSGETLTGTPTITEDTTTDLTLTNKAVSTAALTINDRAVGIGKAIQCLVSGQVVGRSYLITVTCGTTASRTMKCGIKLECV